MAASLSTQPQLLEPHIYEARFSQRELQEARLVWKAISAYLQQWVSPTGTTLDLGAGYCHFINNIASRHRIAVDVNQESLERHADPRVRCVTTSGADLTAVADNSIDAVFASNVYEHFCSREEVAQSFREVRRILVTGGRFIILQPNFRYCMKRYFDFFDHRLAFTHLAMAEGLRISGFEIEKVVDRFLPYTSKSSLPKWPWLVSCYLRFPWAWKILGAQMLIVARKPG